MTDRKYRQQGYRGGGGGDRDRDRCEPPRPSGGTFGILQSKATSRCAECGTVLPITAQSLTECPQCRASLHTCRQCAHFDPAARFECAKDVPERIADKRAKNDCARFSMIVTVERDTSGGAVRPNDARQGFGNLFKT